MVEELSFKISMIDSIASILFVILFLFALIPLGIQMDPYLPNIFLLIFINAIFVLGLMASIYRLKGIFFDKFTINEDEITQTKCTGKEIRIRWDGVTKMNFSHGDFFIHLYAENTQICIYYRIHNIENLLKLIRDHLDVSLTQIALNNLEKSTFISLK